MCGCVHCMLMDPFFTRVSNFIFDCMGWPMWRQFIVWLCALYGYGFIYERIVASIIFSAVLKFVSRWLHFFTVSRFFLLYGVANGKAMPISYVVVCIVCLWFTYESIVGQLSCLSSVLEFVTRWPHFFTEVFSFILDSMGWPMWGKFIVWLFALYGYGLIYERIVRSNLRVNSGRSQCRAKTTTSRSPSQPRMPSRGNTVEPHPAYGRDWGLPNNYGGALTSQWGVVEDQQGTTKELASTRSTSHLGIFPKLVIKRWPQVVLSANHGRGCVVPLYHTHDRFFSLG